MGVSGDPVTLGRFLLCTGILAALISLHHTLARYLFALGRERLLPRRLGPAAPRTPAPRAASLTQSVLAAAAIATCVGLHFDPTGRLVRRLAGALGLLVLLTGTSLAALVHLNRQPGPENAWRRFLAPGFAQRRLVEEEHGFERLAAVVCCCFGLVALSARRTGLHGWRLRPAVVRAVRLLEEKHARPLCSAYQ
jgi:amino acid transporter